MLLAWKTNLINVVRPVNIFYRHTLLSVFVTAYETRCCFRYWRRNAQAPEGFYGVVDLMTLVHFRAAKEAFIKVDDRFTL